MRQFIVHATLALISITLKGQDARPFTWEISYEHRLPPIWFNSPNTFSTLIIYNADQQLSGNGVGGTITKRIHRRLGLFYKTHIRYDHLYNEIDTSSRVVKNMRTWMSDHLFGASYSIEVGSRQNVLLIRLGAGWMNRGSNYGLSERVEIANFPPFFVVTEHEFHYSANYLEIKYAWQKFGIGLNIYHAHRTRYPGDPTFIHLGTNLSYGIY